MANKYRWKSDGKLHSIPESTHKANTAAAKRVAPANRNSMGTLGMISARSSGRQSTPGNQNVPQGGDIASPTMQGIGSMAPVTPIAAPPTVQNPFLTPTDEANQSLELADVDSYLSKVDDALKQAEIDYQQRAGQLDTNEGRALDAADWNAAARGLARSSIKDTGKANISSDAAAARTADASRINQQRTSSAGEHNRADTIIRPAIATKYNQLKLQNAQAAADALAQQQQQTSTTDTSGTATTAAAAPAGSSTPTVISQTAQPTTGSGSLSTYNAGTTGSATGYQPVVKNGKFYHYYPATNTYVYIRPAS